MERDAVGVAVLIVPGAVTHLLSFAVLRLEDGGRALASDKIVHRVVTKQHACRSDAKADSGHIEA